MNSEDILMSIHLTEPCAFDLDQARQLLRDHEAWISIDLLAAQVNEVVSTTSIHFTFDTL